MAVQPYPLRHAAKKIDGIYSRIDMLYKQICLIYIYIYLQVSPVPPRFGKLDAGWPTMARNAPSLQSSGEIATN